MIPETASSIDTGTRSRLLLGFITNWISKLSNTIIQLVQVPVFLHFWGVNLYGEWMIVSSIPSYLAFSNIGFGSVAGNEMTMLNSANDRDGALRVFQSCWWLIAAICTATGILFAVALSIIPVADKLKLHAISPEDARWVLLYLGLSVLLSQLEQLVGAAYTSVGRYAFGNVIKSVFTLAAFAATLLPVALGAGPRVTALVYALANTVFTLAFCLMVRRDIPWLRFGWRFASFAEIRRLAPPAVAFMGFPIGNALNLQGTLMAVGYVLGPAEVVVFGTARTVSRVALQMVQLVNTTFWPELSLAYGAKNLHLVRTLHRRSCQAAFFVAIIIVVAMMSFGPWFLTHWTGGHVPPSRPLLAILLLVVILYALWSTSSTLLAATNRHQKLAAYYLFGTALTLVLTLLLARRYGLYGAAASLVLSELVMNTYVLPASIRLSHDTPGGFIASLFDIPHALRPGALLRRLSRPRAKPTIEIDGDIGEYPLASIEEPQNSQAAEQALQSQIRAIDDASSSPATHIAVVEPQMEGLFHAPFNAALLHSVALAYPNSRISFQAFPEHARIVRSIIDENSPAIASRIDWRETPHLKAKSSLTRFLESQRLIHQAADSSASSRVLFCSISRMQLLHLKRFLKHRNDLHVRAVLHGDIDRTGEKWKEPFPNSLYPLERVLLMPHPPALRYLLLGESIRQNIPAEFRQALASSSSIDHPYHFPAMNPPPQNNPGGLVFGIFGNSGEGRLLEEIARAVKAAKPSIHLRMVGFLSDSEAVDRLSPLVQDAVFVPVPREIFVARARTVTHALWLAPAISSRLRASGTFFDALAYGTPLLYTANTFIDFYYANEPGIGTRLETVDQVAQAVLATVDNFTPDAYVSSQQAILRLRRRFTPEAIAQTLPPALDW